MIQINIGGTKGWNKIDPKVRANWLVLDSSRDPDIKYDLNSKELMPFEDNSVDNYYTSHTLEHIDTFIVPFVMSEIYRTLKPGGKIRIVVPDIRVGMRMYLNYNEQLMDKKYCTKDPNLPSTYLGQLMGWWQGSDRGKSECYSGHKTAYDDDTLRWYLSKAGFKNIFSARYDMCSPQFQGLDKLRYEGWSLFVEAIKNV